MDLLALIVQNFLSKTEVTRSQYAAVRRGSAGNRPVNGVVSVAILFVPICIKTFLSRLVSRSDLCNTL